MRDAAQASGLSASELRVDYGALMALRGLNITIEPGSIVALVGPNGSGKTTLLRSLGRLLSPHAGCVVLNGRDLADLRTADVARQLAVLPQAPEVPAVLSVAELVAHGRYAHLGALRRPGKADRDAVEQALALTGMTTMADRDVDTLSGGERQRAWIALTLAQGSPMLLLDEPTTFLDIGHQLEVLELLEGLRSTTGRTVVLVLHDLNQAAWFADRIVVLHQGRIVADGPPGEVVEPGLLARVFGVSAEVRVDAGRNRPVCHWLASTDRQTPQGAGP